MSGQKYSKINQLLTVWPKNTVAVYPWLEKQGISRKLVEQYKKSGWVQPVGSGAVIRRGDNVSWRGALYAVQTGLDKKIHVGGQSALEMYGYAHYVPVRQTVTLFGKPGEILPAWFKKKKWGSEIELHSARLFSNDRGIGLTQIREGEFSIRVATPERAILELLYLVPEKHTYEGAEQIMEGLATLRADLLQKLLEKCGSVKVKRLFMVLAEELGFPWFNKLAPDQIDFGSGKRVLFKGGKLHAKYLITIPRGAGEKK